MSLLITDIPDGQQVTEPGAYRMSMNWYHSQEVCPGPSVSSTGIRKAALESPHAFWKTFYGNPNRYPKKEDSDSLILGKAAHSLVLGDEVFDEHFIYVPKDAPKRPTKTQIANFERDGKWSDAALEGGEYWTEFEKKAAGRLMLKEEQVQKIFWMAENLNANPLAVEILKSDPKLIEVSMIWQDDITGLWLKSRVDCIPTNGYDFGDLKTFAPKSKNLRLSAIRAITDHGYPLQMALGLMGSEHVFGMSAQKCGLVMCQTAEPYDVIPAIVEADTLYWARVLIRDGLNKIKHGMDTGDWPGAGAELLTYEYPPSMTERLSDMQANGELPSV
ncbi:PD-(D/E)XK nuclease-like domain-containing protein [Ruegeria lacuscaerulensis]|uniref:PD-(D/E)XK nuclease-like domain-containing protein n=1 Tax=Ruegeria lacuscaerulensis TaxID=55218 RepID=UPI00147E059B|nr:PD-(D/E)XK nuclease-like domain-containing protein [Ruegeria lacuscaerulensis]